MPSPPSGTVTFVFTDIEGSTPLAAAHPEQWPAAQARHHAILRQAMEARQGYIFRIVGDAFSVAFHTAGDALQAALAAQRALLAEAWGDTPIRVRMGLHTGAAQFQDGDYEGYLTLARTQRIMALAHGGQLLLSITTADLLLGDIADGVSLRDLGEHPLKGLTPEHLWQVVAAGLPVDFPPLPSVNAPNNLPVQLTSFIGRENEIADVKRLLAGSHAERGLGVGALATTRLLTLTGSGGTGKTRLSLQVAAEVLDRFKHGVWFVELAPLSDPELVPTGVASVLGVHEAQGRPLLTTLLDWLRDKQLLLILDNCEHLIDACARFADAVLRTSRETRILASSREALGIAGELVYPVPSLHLPNPKDHIPAEQLKQYEAVRLFVERAIFALPTFTLTDANAPAVAQVCSRLDGIPLAIELAAARVKALPVETIAERLDDRFRLLTGGSRTALPRQQTLRSAVDWSYELLSQAERTLLRRLSVFAGGWTLEAAEAVRTDDVGATNGSPLQKEDVLDLLTHLVDKSLVLMESVGDQSRYHMLETIRQFAREKLLESGEAERMRDRHLAYFMQQALAALATAGTAQGVEAATQAKADYDNERSALEWAMTRDAQSALHLAAALGFWNEVTEVAYPTQLLDLLRQALTIFEQLPPVEGEAARTRMHIRARALAALAIRSVQRGDNQVAREAAAESVELFRSLGNRREMASPLFMGGLAALFSAEPQQGMAAMKEAVRLERASGTPGILALQLTTLGQYVARIEHDIPTARDYLEEALRLQRGLGHTRGTASSLLGLGLLALLQGDEGQARALLMESLALAEALDPKRLANMPRSALADLARLQGRYAEAEARYHEVIGVWHEIGNRGAIARCLECLAFIAGAQAQPRRAAQLLGAAAAIRDVDSLSMAPDEQREYEALLPSIRAQLDEATFAAEWSTGHALTLEQAIDFAQQSPQPA